MRRVVARSAKKRACKSGKVRFRDHQSATRALRTARARSSREVVPQRAYECPMCKGWHLTSEELR